MNQKYDKRFSGEKTLELLQSHHNRFAEYVTELTFKQGHLLQLTQKWVKKYIVFNSKGNDGFDSASPPLDNYYREICRGW